MSRSDQQVPDVVRTPDPAGRSDAPRSQVQFFVPAPEDLPPPETVFGPGRRRSAGAIPDPADRRDVYAPHLDGDDAEPAPDDRYPGRLGGDALPGPPGPGDGYADPHPGDRYAGPGPDAPVVAGVPDAPVLGGMPGVPAAGPVPDAPVLSPPYDGPSHHVRPSADEAAPPGGVPDAPVLPAARHSGAAPARPRRQAIDRNRLAVVYDIDGPRVRLGVAWFLGALVATLIPLPLAAAVVYAVAAGLAARQLVRAWGSVPWQADVAAGLGSVPVLAALVGPQAVVATCALGAVVAVGCACAPDGARLRGGEGRVAAAGILCLSLVPALGAASFVLVRRHSVIAALVLLVVASAYEMGDYIVGSGGSTPVEGPLAGITTATLLALPLALVLVEPYDTAGVVLLPLTALACPLGQVVASAVLPGAAAPAPALRRIDTLLLLAPVWAAAAGAI
ncbi:MAG TPA: hypothetical protein VFH36_10270 [Acidimicrobiales bacterium]|nr:hypothetical protein [Acidimicrobiales bacterium]